jgi:hypothetical protein
MSNAQVLGSKYPITFSVLSAFYQFHQLKPNYVGKAFDMPAHFSSVEPLDEGGQDLREKKFDI